MNRTQTLVRPSTFNLDIGAVSTGASPGSATAQPLEIRTPALDDGSQMWELARDSESLDLNSSYSYLLWCRDFADSSAIAFYGDEPAGFVTGYTRPEAPDTLMIWQVAVDEAFRGRGLASMMLESVVDRTEPDRLETTITSDNRASIHLFSSFAERRGASCTTSPIFPSDLYPDEHATEHLYEIGPLR